MFNRKSNANSGITLVEVLISIGLLGVGLLGVAAVFPVGSYYTRKGDVSDRGAAIAQAAFADFIATNKHNPDNLMHWYDDARTGGSYFANNAAATGAGNNNFGPLGGAIRPWLAAQTGVVTLAGTQNFNSLFGSAYIVDPLGMSAAANLNAMPAGSNAPWGTLQPSAFINDPRWAPFADSWPVRRICTSSVMVNGRPNRAASLDQFRSSDDLSLGEVAADSPARFQFEGLDSSGDGVVDVPMRRQEKGDFSWFVSIVPSSAEALSAIATDPSAFYYDVSVVVFFKRNPDVINVEERLVSGSVVSTGTGGGELVIERLNDGNSESPFKNLKEGQWVMVTGPHPNSTSTRPILFSQWYRVLAINDKDELPITRPDAQRLIGLRGPDWPWQGGQVGNNRTPMVSVGLFPGAVAVHTKTIRLDNRGVWQY